MLVFFIYSMEVALVCLLGTMMYRIKNLYCTDIKPNGESVDKVLKRLMNGKSASSEDYDKKMNALNKAQSFAGMQLLEIKRSYGDLSQDKLEWLREAISLYLIGAIDLFGKESKCNAQQRKELIHLVLRSSLRLSENETSKYFKEALYRKLSSDNDMMVRAGAKAAKSWMLKQNIPNEITLSKQLDEWGVFA